MTGLTEMEVRLQFAKEEEEDARKGVPALHDVSPSGFVTAGLELEEQQCVALVLCMILGLTVDKATCARSGGTEESRVNKSADQHESNAHKAEPGDHTISAAAINIYAGGNTSPRQASRSRRRGTGRERPAHAAVLVDGSGA